MNERKTNLCHAAGCTEPACCRDINIHGVNGAEINKFFPNAIYFAWDLSNIDPNKNAVYYTDPHLDEGKNYLVIIVGPCPNLNQGNCTSKPKACSAMKRGGEKCNKLRARFSLEPVPHELKE